MNYKFTFRPTIIAACTLTMLFSACAPQQRIAPRRQPESAQRQPQQHQNEVEERQQLVTTPSLREPTHPNGYQKKAYQALAQHNYRSAESLLERGIRSDPRNGGIWYDLARVRYMEGRYQESFQYAQKAKQLVRSNSDKTLVEEILLGAKHKQN